MGVNLMSNLPQLLSEAQDYFGYMDDFLWYSDGGLWTKLASDSGASVAIDTTAGTAHGGRVLLTTGATDNNEAAIYWTNKTFTVAANRALIFEARIKYTEANTDDANVAVGWSSASAANLLQDNGAGPAASQTGLQIFKVDGGTAWKTLSSLSTTQTITTSTRTAGGSTSQILRICVLALDSTTAEVTYYCSDANNQKCIVPLYNASPSNARPGTNVIKDIWTYTSAADMTPYLYVKAGGANSEVLGVDYAAAYSIRL